MTTLHRRHAMALAALSLLSLPAFAQTSGSSTAPPAGGVRPSRADRGFMEQAAQNGQAEIEASRLAVQKAADPQVQRFARTMVEEHMRMGDELRTLARAKGVELPTEPSMLQRGRLKLLSTADGEAFTRRYVEAFGIDAHQETIKLFEDAAGDADDPEIKAFAARGLPGLQRHLTMARELPLDKGNSPADGANRPASGGTR
jgi:putative membrane protein